MLSAATLERVSVAYRRGYYDGYAGKHGFCEVKPEYIKPFADHDYSTGYYAGANDHFWSIALYSPFPYSIIKTRELRPGT